MKLLLAFESVLLGILCPPQRGFRIPRSLCHCEIRRSNVSLLSAEDEGSRSENVTRRKIPDDSFKIISRVSLQLSSF